MGGADPLEGMTMGVRRWVAALVLMPLLAGCATQEGPRTASGSPEVTITGARAEQVKPAIVNAMLNSGLRIKSDTTYNIVFEKQDTNMASAIIFGTGYGPPVHRVTFAVAEVPGATRIVADSATFSNAGTAFERRGPAFPEFPPERLQAMLDEIAVSLRRQPSPPPGPAPAPKRG